MKMLRALWAVVAAVAMGAAADEGSLAPGHLENAGVYRAAPIGGTVSVLADGSVFVFGYGPAVDERHAQRVLTATLRDRRNARRLPEVDPDPKLWDASARGWRRLSRAPECEGAMRYLHTATVLKDGRVLVAGGLCDAPKMGDDPTPWPPHEKASLWDSKSRKWIEGVALRHARIHHSATLMPDGSVVVAGGETDPILEDAAEPVIAAVERFNGAAFEAAPTLREARARHAATALTDGTLLVTGGFDHRSRALASVEMLAPGAGAWQSLPPMREARHSHTATLLADGRVLVVGGKNADERALTSTEIWDPARGAWLSGPQLPVALNGHAAARLANGEVLVAGGAWIASPLALIPWAWTWSAASADWKAAGQALPADETKLSSGVSIVPRADNSATIFTQPSILRWVPGPAVGGPMWDSQPSIAPIHGARAMVVAYEVGAETNTAIARVWNAATKSWSAAGRPVDRERMDSATAQLPSGRVIHVGVNMQNTLVCHAWEPPDRWSPCGTLKLEYPHSGRPHLGALPDGRAFVIVSEHEAAVLDESRRTWSPARLEWNRSGFAYGAPVRREAPFVQLLDPANGAWTAIDEAGARFYNRNLSGGQVALLWDPRASRWAYVLRDKRMGADAQWLPDGCAISTHPLALFDPRQAQARALADPGLGVALGQATLAVLDDGTVVVAGVAEAKGMGSGFFHRKASCAGFAAEARDAAYISADLAVDAPRPTPAVAPAKAEANELGARMERMKRIAWENRWLLLAALAPFVLWLALRRTALGRASAPASRGFRVVIYLIIAVILAPFVLQFVPFHLATSSVECLDSPLRCKSDPPWWVALARKAKPQAPPPCKLVGVWSSQRAGAVNRIELKDDGTYEMGGNGRTYSGLWRVEGNQMIWQHEQAPGVRDANPMAYVTDTRFNLTEQDGQLTRFELIRSVPSTTCTP
jgi:hypothetical protein